jgi:hypothetical protein
MECTPTLRHIVREGVEVSVLETFLDELPSQRWPNSGRPWLQEPFNYSRSEMQRVHRSLQALAFFRSTSKAIMLVL